LERRRHGFGDTASVINDPATVKVDETGIARTFAAGAAVTCSPFTRTTGAAKSTGSAAVSRAYGASPKGGVIATAGNIVGSRSPHAPEAIASGAR
jgi:hypothetical protein